MDYELKIGAYIRSHQLLTPQGLHLVAVSGGADSVALLLVLLKLGYHLEAVHCNFHLRGEESNRDEKFVESLCLQLNIPLHLIHFDTEVYAKQHQVSLEMAARQLRYRYFEQLRHDIDAETVCVAHHQDDAVETLLMNLLRGAGIHGLTGIRPRMGHVVRPLLAVGREETEAYLRSCNQTYVTDSTNLSPCVLRNKVRLQLVPLLRQLNPSASANIARSAHYLAEAEKVFDHELSRQLAELGSALPMKIPVGHVLSQPSPLAFLHEWLYPYGFTRQQTEDICSHLSAAQQAPVEYLSPTHTLIIHHGQLLLEQLLPPVQPLKIPEPGVYRCTDDLRLAFRLENPPEAASLKTAPTTALLDARKVQFPLTVRPVQTADRFRPFGMKGSRLVSDFLTDRKLNLLEKRRQLVVADATGTILWIVGLRSAEGYRVTESTTAALRMEVLKG